MHPAASADKKEKEAAMQAIRARLQHRLNPLHVYCRLRDCGLGDQTAQRLSSCWERLVYRLVLA